MTNNQKPYKKTLLTNAMGLKRLPFLRNWNVCLLDSKKLYREILSKCEKVRESGKSQRLSFGMQAVSALATTTNEQFYIEIVRRYTATLSEKEGQFKIGSIKLAGTLLKTYSNISERQEVVIRVRDERGMHCIVAHLDRIGLDYNTIITAEDTLAALESLVSTAAQVIEAKPYVMPIFHAATTGNLGETASNLRKKMPTPTTYRNYPHHHRIGA